MASRSTSSPSSRRRTSSPPPSLRSPLLGMPGVGPRTAERLAARGLHTRGDLLELLPRRWDDLRAVTPLAALVPGQPQTTVGRVLWARWSFGRRRSLEVRFGPDDGSGGAQLTGRWFHARSGMKERFAAGSRFLLAGVVRELGGQRTMVHPETERLDDGDEVAGRGAGLRARYPEVEGVPARLLAELAAACARDHAAEADDAVPPALAAARGFGSRGAALARLHLATAGEELAADEVSALNDGAHPAQRQLAWEELFLLQLGLLRRRARQRSEPAPVCPTDGAALSRLLAALPFAATPAQLRAIDEVAADLARPRPMHRLLQGEVGAGKTVVVFAAAELAMAAGRQAALLAPTAILAEQHARTLAPWATACGRRLALLTASTPRAERASIRAELAAGRIDLAIGTHALLGDEVRLPRLGLAVVDEQHRFGVAQRAALGARGVEGGTPHLLVLSATPIPRTLALTVWGDLDLTTLEGAPPGRAPPRTSVHHGARGRQRAHQLLSRALGAGRQGYVVCPRVEDIGAADEPEGELGDADAGSAIATCARLGRALPGVSIGLCHGRLPAAERDRVMRDFAAGRVQLLVATTVIEVGVDVPAADVLLIEGAERFGLAQLHQLRGRIGRPGRPTDQGPPLCLLVTDAAADSEAASRLARLVDSHDGLAIAEVDLALRGAGEILGTRQAGLPRLRFADLGRHLDLLVDARQAAAAVLAADPELEQPEHQAARRLLAARWPPAMASAEDAG